MFFLKPFQYTTTPTTYILDFTGWYYSRVRLIRKQVIISEIGDGCEKCIFKKLSSLPNHPQHMKPIFLLAIIVASFSCKGLVKNEEPAPKDTALVPVKVEQAVAKTTEPAANSNLTVSTEKDLVGYWVGMFMPDDGTDKTIYGGEHILWDYANKINLSIDSIGGGAVAGHSVVAGNARPFRGSYKLENNSYSFTVKEPGDDRYDGEFNFTITVNDSVINGSWKAYKKIETAKRKYALQKKIFKYDPTITLDYGRYGDWQKTKKVEADPGEELDYDKSYFATSEDVFKYNASVDELTKEQVSNLKKADLFIIRNTIYAKHGYSFKNRQLRAFFDKQQWYIPVHADIKADFTSIEKQNIDLLLRYEEHAKEYYDVFGRG